MADKQVKYSQLGRFALVKTLGSGYNSKVKLGIDINTNSEFAVKILKKTVNVTQNTKAAHTEIETLAHLRHPNIVNIIEAGDDADYVKKSGEVEKVLYIVLELAKGGELFDFVASTGRFDEPTARYYFHQLIESLEYIHSRGYAHRDLKPENLLFDERFNLKVADFGFSIALSGRDGSGRLRTSLGTESYMAPEIHEKLPYSGISVDLFAAAIILFIMTSGTPPFGKAMPRDAYYKTICTNRHDIFWAAHCKNKKEGDKFFSPEFKALMNAMLAYDPGQRISIAEIKASAWYRGATPTGDDIYKQFLMRKKLVDDENEKVKAKKTEEKAIKAAMVNQNLAFQGPKPKHRGMDTDTLDSTYPDLTLKRTEEPYYKTQFLANNEIFVDCDVSTALHQAVYALQDFSSKKFDQKQYRFNCDKLLNDEDKLSLLVKIKKVDETTSCIEIKRVDGPHFAFLKTLKKFKKMLNADDSVGEGDEDNQNEDNLN